MYVELLYGTAALYVTSRLQVLGCCTKTSTLHRLYHVLVAAPVAQMDAKSSAETRSVVATYSRISRLSLTPR